jgi:hypothetical protein
MLLKTGLLSIPDIMLPISGCPPPCLLRGTSVGCGTEDGGPEAGALLLLALVFREAKPSRNCWATEIGSWFWLTDDESLPGSVVLPDGFTALLRFYKCC